MDNIKRIFFRIRNILILILLMNIVVINAAHRENRGLFIVMSAILICLYFYINIVPLKTKKLNKRLNIMIGGYELIVDSTFVFIIEILLYIFLYRNKGICTSIHILNVLICVVVLFITVFNGIVRLIFTSRDLGVKNRILILCLCWFPILNLIIIKISCKKVNYEYLYELKKAERNNLRKESEVCNTKYPVVLVHGIFFRDWLFLKYWGRISNELERNGAVIYYGNQGSSNSVAVSASELKTNIMKIIKETGCEKVNIIAHSKGGLDARYAISKLGLSEYVSSLTTINTPHRGCKYVDFLLDKIPESIKSFVALKYNNAFKKLGDKNPDFLGGVNDLTAKSCKQFNDEIKNVDSIMYQSVASKMKNVFSAGFPLNLGYLFAKHFDGENDGLVSVSSAKWGNFLGVLTAKNRGISHGDIIDLTRQNIEGFDVCEFYVNLVNGLKEKGM